MFKEKGANIPRLKLVLKRQINIFMTMKVISILLICLLLVSVANGEEGGATSFAAGGATGIATSIATGGATGGAVRVKQVTCNAGEGVTQGLMFSAGDASQCSGINKIKTREACRAQAEYNRKKQIDDNFGFVDNREKYIHGSPYGCSASIDRHGRLIYSWHDHWNNNLCSAYTKCICKNL